MQIEFSCHSVEYSLAHEEPIKETIQEILTDHQYSGVYINYIFCDDKDILEINQEYLNHDYITDIITFPYIEESDISTDIYICVPQVIRNAEDFDATPDDEMARVVFHGMLHLVGYDDHTEEDIAEMRGAEAKYLARYHELIQKQ